MPKGIAPAAAAPVTYERGPTDGERPVALSTLKKPAQTWADSLLPSSNSKNTSLPDPVNTRGDQRGLGRGTRLHLK